MTTSRGTRLLRTIPAFAVTGVLALGVTACGSDDDTSSTANDAATTQTQATKPAAQVDDVTGGTTQVTLDKGFVEALGTLKLTPAPVGDAKISDAGVASFPVTGGNVTYYKPGTVSPFVQGELDHDGSGLSLTGGGKKVELTDFKIDPGASVLTGKVSVDGEVAAESAPLFFLDGRTLQPLRTASGGKTAILQGTTVKLKQEAADLLNQTFGTDALKGGLVIGVAKISVPTGA
ncbi:hypothetical protein [Patulibacter sp. SYSU D01012]|uniref:hypothetical protein n=1 Tax=Patulibacter sp. SYSU D01012 TaxID=2817381 RepID=UPI001B30AC2C|nr:hypothetical protein [Patulibacter sp. SYSU D01012]